jgi:phosphoribosylglycinamide formyltransferase 1
MAGEVPRIGILASGKGSTAEMVILATQTGALNAKVEWVISNNENPGVFGVVDRANADGLNITKKTISKTTHPGGPAGKFEQTDDESAAIADLCEGLNFVVLLGYLRKVRGRLLESGVPLLNFHPAILPHTAGFFGLGASEEAMRQGLPHTAFTAHWVVEEYDIGPKVFEKLVPILPGDTPDNLFMAVQAREKAFGPKVINDVLDELRAR